MGEITPQCIGNTASSQFPFVLQPNSFLQLGFRSKTVRFCWLAGWQVGYWLVVVVDNIVSRRQGKRQVTCSNYQPICIQQKKNHKEKRINMSIGSSLLLVLSSVHRAEFSIFLVHIFCLLLTFIIYVSESGLV